jgi:hypothetical protein
MPFKPGQSGNPAGRRPRTDTEQRQREQIRKALPGIVARLIHAAESGDTTASKLLLERIMPAYKPLDRPVVLELGPDLAEAGRAVLAAVGAGRLTPDQANSLLASITSLVRVIEATELEARITALDAAHADHQP